MDRQVITEALLHCPQIGPARLAKLNESGIRTWQDVLARADELSSGIRGPIVEETQRCQNALAENDITYFVDNLATKDRWRILAQFLDDVSYFDIETAGLEYDDPITVICCWHKGDVHTFVENENLDDFLNLLDDVTLLSSFNGSTFDVPRVLDTFHIPQLPCPHLDLRWLCYHQGLRGGLKEITLRLNIQRPVDLQDADGEMAIRLWQRWIHFQDQQARADLIRYCASDVVLLLILSRELAGEIDDSKSFDADALWAKLPTASRSNRLRTPTPATETTTNSTSFGDASPKRLRGLRRRVG